jgi:hypothetical protein
MFAASDKKEQWSSRAEKRRGEEILCQQGNV